MVITAECETCIGREGGERGVPILSTGVEDIGPYNRQFVSSTIFSVQGWITDPVVDDLTLLLKQSGSMSRMSNIFISIW